MSRRRKTPVQRLFAGLSLMVMAWLLAGASATTYVATTIDDMLAAAEIAFYGEVESTTVVERDRMPWTEVRFRIERDLTAGDQEGPPPDVIELAFLGGALPGGPTLVVAQMPRFAPGERVLVLAYDADVASPIVGFRQGLWRLSGESLVGDDGRRLGLEGGELVAEGERVPLGDVLAAIAARLGERP